MARTPGRAADGATLAGTTAFKKNTALLENRNVRHNNYETVPKVAQYLTRNVSNIVVDHRECVEGWGKGEGKDIILEREW